MKRIAYTEVTGPEAKGNASINQLDNGRYELTLSDFWVALGAPDVWVAISPEIDGIPGVNKIDLASYAYNDNEHRFLLEETIDLDEIKAVIIYCKKFNIHFGHGVLNFESNEPTN